MPKNLRGGKHKHKKKGFRYAGDDTLVLAGDQLGRMYAIITKKMGGGIFEIQCSNGKVEKALIPGKFRRKVWMNEGDLVLVESELDKYFIIHKYNNDQAKQLKSRGEITFDIKGNNEDDTIAFEEDENLSDNNPDNNSDDEFKKLVENNSFKKMEGNDDNLKGMNITEDKTLNEFDIPEGETSIPETEDEEEPPENKEKKVSLLNKFKNKARGNKIVNEINRSSARDHKVKTLIENDIEEL